jgi:hypothetical protein
MSGRDRTPRGARIFGYVIAIVVNVVLWYVVHNLGRWDLSFILSEEFSRVLPAFDLSLGASIVLYALWVAYDLRWFRHLGQVVLNALSLNVIYVLYRVFPFRFPGSLDQWARVGLLLGGVAVGISTVVVLFRLFVPAED